MYANRFRGHVLSRDGAHINLACLHFPDDCYKIILLAITVTF